MIRRKRAPHQIVYWGIFLLCAVIVSYLLVTLIRASAREDTAFAQTTNIKRQAKTAAIETSQGTIRIRFDRAAAPQTVSNFIRLAQDDFFDGTKFHRVLKAFLIQGGDPNSKEDDRTLWGKGGPGYMIPDEFSEEEFSRGVIAMANVGKPNTGGSQFFIFLGEEAPLLDGKYTIFGTVIEGMDVADRIGNGETDKNEFPLVPTTIIDVVVE